MPPLLPSSCSSSITPLFRLLTPLFQSNASSISRPPRPATSSLLFQNFSTSHRQNAPPINSKKIKVDKRITLIRYHMQHPATPRPLKFSRMRALRHWTIHRAWMLVRRKKKESEERELYRMYQSMQAANEELCTMEEGQGGRLFRIAQEKRGVFGHGGVPIEYARWQTDTPAKEAWNHGWTRQA